MDYIVVVTIRFFFLALLVVLMIECFVLCALTNFVTLKNEVELIHSLE